MIKINLLGQARPKAAGAGVPLESTIRVGMLVGALAIAGIILGINYVQMGQDLDKTNQEIRTLTVEKTRLQAIKTQVEQFRSQKAVLQQRIDVIENLQRSRTGGQDLLAMVANTVVRTDSLWLTSLTRKGNSLAIQGEAGSINAVANFITQLKRSGAFGKVEIKEARENDMNPAVAIFSFTMTAEFIQPGSQSASAGAQSSTPGKPGKS